MNVEWVFLSQFDADVLHGKRPLPTFNKKETGNFTEVLKELLKNERR